MTPLPTAAARLLERQSIRYVAVHTNGQVATASRLDLAEASSAESDTYEELLVNPTLLRLAQARGDIDCGGLRYLIVGYGQFHQVVVRTVGGHLSVAVELSQDPYGLVPEILAAAAKL